MDKAALHPAEALTAATSDRHRISQCILALALPCALLLALLTAPAQALARTQRSNCPTAASSHAGRTGACPTRSDAARRARGSSARARRSAARRAKARRATQLSRAKARHVPTPRAQPNAAKGNSKGSGKGKAPQPAAPSPTPARCEDGGAPVRSEESFSCADGSLPSCESGASPQLASGEASLVCPALVATDAGQGEGEEAEPAEAAGCEEADPSAPSGESCEPASED